MAINSMVSGGCIISGAMVRESLLFSDVRVEERTTIERSVVLPHTLVGSGCQICGAILDEGCDIPAGMRIGLDRADDARRFLVTEKGVVVVTPDMLRRLSP
jgi:glucose-1-phosphate adenylyltransferase